MRFLIPSSAIALVVLTGCPGSEGPTDDVIEEREWATCTDNDDDGVCEEDQDCDDSDPEVYLGRVETCNGKDDNCNGVIDEGLPDSDQDGICDGEDVEECDGKDNDGDSLIDEDFGDADGDGIADCVDYEECDGVDNNGDGNIDEGFDADLDGATVCGDVDGNNVDCDDDAAAVFPGATESADGVDNDCDGLIDEGGWVAGDLVITEMMVNPSAVGDASGEWIEVLNASGKAVFLNGLELRDSNGQSHKVTSDAAIEVGAGEYALLAINGRPDQNGRVTPDYVYDTIRLSNQIDDLEIWVVDAAPTGDTSTMIDAVSWDETYPVIPGASLVLEPGYIGADLNDTNDYWCPGDYAWVLGSDLGSPGEANPPCLGFDHDGDGYSVTGGDCDDASDEVYPGAPEIDASVDNDCDGDAEYGPVASGEVLTEVSELAVCGVTYMDASDTRDTDGGTVEGYEWSVSSKPSASSLDDADIRNASTSLASFEADADGTYEFEVVGVDDGGARGAPAKITVEVASRTDNEDPVADAGENKVATEESSCVSIGGGLYNCTSCSNKTFSLDGTRSSDLDGDSLSYTWTVTSGPGTLSDRYSDKTTVTVSGATPTPGGRGVSTVFVDLVVTDCMGATSVADTMAVVYSCLDD